MKLKDKLEFFRDKGYTYDKNTGFVYNPKGKKLETNDRNYIVIITSKDNKTIKVRAHQFAWYMTYNEVPIEIDHINCIKNDNRIDNLRNINHQKNCFNRNYKGYCKHHDKYRATIMLNGEKINLGRYKTENEAREAYLDAKKIYHII